MAGIAYQPSGFAWTNRNSGEDPNVSLNVLTSSTQVEYAWNGMYKVIAEVNAFLDYLNKVNSRMISKTSWGQKHVSCVVLPITTWFPILVTFPGELQPLLPMESLCPVRRKNRCSDWLSMISSLLWCYRKHKMMAMPQVWQPRLIWAKCIIKWLAWTLINKRIWTMPKAMFDEVYGKYQLQPKFGDLFVDNVNGTKNQSSNWTITQSPLWYSIVLVTVLLRLTQTVVSHGGRTRQPKALRLDACYLSSDPRLEINFLTSWRQHKNNQADDVPQRATNRANDSTYSYPYITYKVKGVYVMKDGKPVMENGIPLQQDFVAELPYADMEDPSNPSIAKFIGLYQDGGGNESW